MNQLTPRDRPERASEVTIECTPDATAIVTFTPLQTEERTQFVIHVNGEQVHHFESDVSHQTQVAAGNGDHVKAGVFRPNSPFNFTEETCNAISITTTTTVPTTETTIPVTTTTTAQPAPLTELPFTGAEVNPLLPTAMLVLGITLAHLGRKKE